MYVGVMGAAITPVALRKESVDRNQNFTLRFLLVKVALRKESVDRNGQPFAHYIANNVALRKESVDRNKNAQKNKLQTCGRSPQGERG